MKNFNLFCSFKITNVKNEMTALDWAEENEHAEIVALLREAMTEEKALTEEEEDVVEEAKNTPPVADTSFSEANPISEEHMTALIYASHHGQIIKVMDLIAKCSDVNIVDEVCSNIDDIHPNIINVPFLPLTPLLL